ncbi:hypothetical protein [Janibacter corallicola]|uniref:hypothetical protein n=1 Tax=Janibacter corallicola TaxID=415212 RepID=UPI000B18E778|nr:hypothetical protein [Janibacter corallicola]
MTNRATPTALSVRRLLQAATRYLTTGDAHTAIWATATGAARDTITQARTALEPLGDDLEDDTINLINDVITTERRHA